MAELETMLATERASLERQVEAGEEVVRLQGQLSTLLEERALGAARQMDAFEAARKARVDFFARLPRNWSGQLRCLSDDGNTVDKNSTLIMSFEEFTANGVNGVMDTAPGYAASTVAISVVYADDALSFPIHFRVQGTGARHNVPETFEVAITQDGKMAGEQKLQCSVDERPVDVTCAFRLAAS